MALPLLDKTFSIEITLDELIKLTAALEKDIGQTAALHKRLITLILPESSEKNDENPFAKWFGPVPDGTSAETVGSPTLNAITEQEPEGGV
jgi:hypothetical protein